MWLWHKSIRSSSLLFWSIGLALSLRCVGLSLDDDWMTKAVACEVIHFPLTNETHLFFSHPSACP